MAPPHVIDLTDSEGPNEFGAGRTPLQTVNNRAIAKRAPAPKKKAAPAKKTKAHVLIWHPHWGSEGGKKVKVMGVYSTKEKAMAAKEEIMNRYEECGHGDILVGGTFHDEIDLLIRPADCFLDA
jgi:hypothetical protein